MFVEQLRRAVEASPRVALAKVAGLLWRAYAAGHVTEAEASELSEAIELKRALPVIQKPVHQLLGSRPRTRTLVLDHIGALAGVSRATVKRALREAQRHGLVRVEER